MAYYSYINDLDRATKECWKIYYDPNTPETDKLVALRTVSEINDRKLAMSQEVVSNYHHDHDMT